MRKVVHYDQIYLCAKFGNFWSIGSNLFLFYKWGSIWILENSWNIEKDETGLAPTTVRPKRISPSQLILEMDQGPLASFLPARVATTPTAPLAEANHCRLRFSLPTPCVPCGLIFTKSLSRSNLVSPHYMALLSLALVPCSQLPPNTCLALLLALHCYSAPCTDELCCRWAHRLKHLVCPSSPSRSATTNRWSPRVEAAEPSASSVAGTFPVADPLRRVHGPTTTAMSFPTTMNHSTTTGLAPTTTAPA
jgi:hypothetical protein